MNHLPHLKVLNAAGYNCRVSDAGVQRCLALEELNIRHNYGVTTVNHLSHLRVLNATDCLLDDITNCRRLKKLVVCNNRRIKCLNHLTHLEELHLEGDAITDDGIRGCINVKRLYLYDASNITSLNHMTHLEVLVMPEWRSGVTDAGIANCHHIRVLDIHDNPKITTLNHLVHLEVLDIGGWRSKIADAGIASPSRFIADWASMNPPKMRSMPSCRKSYEHAHMTRHDDILIFCVVLNGGCPSDHGQASEDDRAA